MGRCLRLNDPTDLINRTELVCSFQTEDSEIDVDEDDEEGEEEDEEDDLEEDNDSLEAAASKPTRPAKGALKPQLLEESDNDF